MRGLVFALIGLAPLGAVAVNGIKLNAVASAAADAKQQLHVERFLMQASGDGHSCVVEKQGEGALSRVVVAPDCEAMLPGLTTLHYWRESADGTVMLSGDGAAPTVVFAQADGVAYESIEPRTPLIALISQD